VHYKFKIEMFDQEVYKKLNRISHTEQVTMNERICRSSGHVATLRWNNLRIQPMVREHLKFIGATAVPSRETNLRRGPCCFGDYVRGVLEGEGQNYINIPITREPNGPIVVLRLFVRARRRRRSERPAAAER
jgi:hypothetical protein